MAKPRGLDQILVGRTCKVDRTRIADHPRLTREDERYVDAEIVSACMWPERERHRMRTGTIRYGVLIDGKVYGVSEDALSDIST